MLNLINSGDGHPLCTVHYIEENDCTSRLHAGSMCEIPLTKANQVLYSSNTGRTVQGKAALFILYLWALHSELSRGPPGSPRWEKENRLDI